MPENTRILLILSNLGAKADEIEILLKNGANRLRICRAQTTRKVTRVPDA